MKRSAKSGNTWQDHYTRQAKKERYPARSVFKLKEIQSKFQVLHKNNRVLDLGCSPGSWLLYAAQVVGTGGRVVGIDLKPVSASLPAQVAVFEGDALDADMQAQWGGPFDVVMSDMAPSTTGNKHVDTARSLGLCEGALWIAEKWLVPGGAFVCKIFQGGDTKAFTDTVRAAFSQVKLFKPQSSRKASKEIFIVGLGRRHAESDPASGEAAGQNGSLESD